ncbi:unnamed protein product [Rotaria sordida]|uniref:Uncharacterized protein n=1 Tax=Rotaria sordida TaxID=392033 RepID=A0A820CHQ9_9BILA|nr:unnamed protein product [Rotaria sordida]CAF4207499.1 unnamed protein product [Rotaria sordida]
MDILSSLLNEIGSTDGNDDSISQAQPSANSASSSVHLPLTFDDNEDVPSNSSSSIDIQQLKKQKLTTADTYEEG